MMKCFGVKQFEDFVEIVGNRYEAINIICAESRRRAGNISNVLDSALLTWVVTGKRPKKDKDEISKLLRKSKSAVDILNYVDNQSVVKSVNLSIGLSKSEGHLIYRYTSNLDEYNRARVRILTNIIWYDEGRN